MHQIFDVFPYESKDQVTHKTRVGLSRSAIKDLDKHATNELLTKLEQCAEKGFANYPSNFPLVHEGGGVWRFAIRDLNVRLVGFFENELTKSVFIIIEVFKKKGQKLTTAEQKVIERIARVKKERAYEWERGSRGRTCEVPVVQGNAGVSGGPSRWRPGGAHPHRHGPKEA